MPLLNLSDKAAANMLLALSFYRQAVEAKGIENIEHGYSWTLRGQNCMTPDEIDNLIGDINCQPDFEKELVVTDLDGTLSLFAPTWLHGAITVSFLRENPDTRIDDTPHIQLLQREDHPAYQGYQLLYDHHG